jgi:hypothetical protein
MTITTTHDAQTALEKYLRSFVEDRPWDKACATFSVLSKTASGSHWLEFSGEKIEKGGFTKSSENIWYGLDAALYLRDEILRTTGRRIWGLTFTLYPDGKCNIEYDYKKPEDYEDGDEVMTGEEINASLNKLVEAGATVEVQIKKTQG